MFTKTRVEIAREMANAARGCWNYYCDDSLPEETAEQFLTDILRRVPMTYSTRNWAKYAMVQKAEEDRAEEDNALDAV